MIDLHCHIIPEVDDGSQSLEQSVQMAREAASAGFTTLCCTSHYYEGQYTVPRNELLDKLKILKQELIDNNIPIDLKIGTELLITSSVSELINSKTISTLNDSSYLLMELPLNSTVTNIDNIIFKIQNLGLTLILAHPERYACVKKDPNYVYELINKGVLLQGNYASLIGKYGSEAENTLKILLKHNMIHFLASDTHRDNSIYTYFDSIFNELNKTIPAEQIELITKINPQKVINNELITIPQPIEYKKKKFLFW